MTNETEEQICKRCGRCCYIKQKVGRMYVNKHRCQHYNEDTSLCNIYPDRFHKKLDDGNYCLTVIEAISLGAHPKDCPYIKHYLKGKKYRCRLMEYQKI